MDLLVARAVPYTAGLLKDALVALSADKKKAQDALVIVDEISGRQWACISIIILLILMNIVFTPYHSAPVAFPI